MIGPQSFELQPIQVAKDMGNARSFSRIGTFDRRRRRRRQRL